MGPQILKKFYSCTIKSILTSCIIPWFGNSTTLNCKALQKVQGTALQDIYTRWCLRKASKVVKDSTHLSHGLFTLLPSGKWYRSFWSQINRL